MLFKIQAFKSPSIISPEKLYSLNVLDGTNEQELTLKDELSDDFVFCQAINTAFGVCLAPQLQLSSDSIRYRMKVGGNITGFAQITKPYVLRDGSAKALNESRMYRPPSCDQRIITTNELSCDQRIIMRSTNYYDQRIIRPTNTFVSESLLFLFSII